MNNVLGPTSFTFKGINWGKVAAGAGVAVAAALLTYISTWINGQSFGDYTTIVMAVWTVIANIARKWISDNE
jgi:uncharacterized membrane protein